MSSINWHLTYHCWSYRASERWDTTQDNDHKDTLLSWSSGKKLTKGHKLWFLAKKNCDVLGLHANGAAAIHKMKRNNKVWKTLNDIFYVYKLPNSSNIDKSKSVKWEAEKKKKHIP